MEGKGRTSGSAALVRRFAGAADRAGAAFALWREPDMPAVQGVLGAVTVGAVDLADPRPGFAVSRFDNFTGEATRLIAADLVLGPDGPRFVGEDGALREAPVSRRQAEFQEQIAAADPTASVLGPDQKLRDVPAPHEASEAEYRGLVARAVDGIRAGRFDKIVASRATSRPLPEGFDPLAMFERLCVRYPHAYVGLTGIPGDGLWIVATPETLLRVEGDRLATMALAGTQPVAPDTPLEDVLWSGKFIEEQALVARYIRRAFDECGIADYDETGPKTVRAANLAHLCSRFVARDPAAASGGAGRLLGLLHPTSAVSGMPRQAAIDFLAAEEGYDRRLYCGFLGPIGLAGSNGDGSAFYVNLRSAQFVGDRICLYVGAGVTGESDPEAEWRETVEKTKTLGAHIDG